MAAYKKLFIEKLSYIVLPLLLFFLLSIFVTYPLIHQMQNMLPGVGDQLLVTWIMNWNLHALFTDPLSLFNANIFYPYKNTLAYSDIFLTSSFLALPLLLILKQPVVAYSWNLILSLTLLGYFTYLLTDYLSRSHFAGVISGVIIAFSTYTLGKISVLQLVSIQWVPLSLFFFLLYIDKQKTKYFVLFCFAFLLQFYNSFLPAYFIAFSAALLSLFHFNKLKMLLLRRNIILLSFATILLMIPIIVPYYQVSREFSYVRDIRDTINFASRLDFLLFPPDVTILEKDLINLFYKHNTNPLIYVGYLGLFFYILLALSLVFTKYYWKQLQKRNLLSFYAIAALGFILSLGPALQWGQHVIKKPFIVPLPYALFYYIIPGFKGIRNSSRWEMLFVLACSIAIGLVLAVFLKKQKKIYQILFTALVVLGVLLEINRPLAYEAVQKKENFPQVYSYIATLPKDSSVIELPLYSWYMTPYSVIEFKREYFSTIHFKPLVNGYSGFSPPEWEKRSNEYMWNFPDDATVKYLRDIGVDYVILHKSEYDMLEKNRYTVQGRPVVTWDKVQKNLPDYNFIKLQKRIDSDYVYQIN